MSKQISGLERLRAAARAATPSCAGMFANVREGAGETRECKTNPNAGASVESGVSMQRDRPQTKPIEAIAGAREGAGKCGDVRKGASTTTHAGDGTKPMPGDLTSRQVAAARLIALGRSGRAVAAEIGVDEHTVTRWRRLPAFASELLRQQELVLAEQCRQRRAASVDAYATVAERVARKYGLVR